VLLCAGLYGNACFIAYHLRYLNGKDLRTLPLIDRKAAVEETASAGAFTNPLTGSRRRRRSVAVRANRQNGSRRNRLQAEGFTAQSHREAFALLDQGELRVARGHSAVDLFLRGNNFVERRVGIVVGAWSAADAAFVGAVLESRRIGQVERAVQNVAVTTAGPILWNRNQHSSQLGLWLVLLNIQ